jgi:UDP-N-acetylglucosamine 1-carboxyvinyltransferase
MEEAFRIRGGKPLEGELEVRGAKNSVLKAMAASLLFEAPVEIENVPLIEDVFRMSELLEELGVKSEKVAKRRLRLDPSKIKTSALDREIAKRFRASIVVAGPLLARMGRVVFPHPGGCLIGKRPIDVFLDGWQAMGAKVREESEESGGIFEITSKLLRGADLTLRVPSVTGTETLMMTAVLAEGTTIIRNAAMEPEIPALAEFLNLCGAHIEGAGTPTITIYGTGGELLKSKEHFYVVPDRIEAGSFLILGAALGNPLKITHCNPDHLRVPLAHLRDMGARLKVGDDWIEVSRPRILSAIEVKTREYPGFPTDLQAPLTVLMTQANGLSVLFETIFENRFGYVEDLKRMGGDIFVADPQRILVKGPTPLRGREIESPDLRAGLAFIFAGLLAKGETLVRNAYQVDRGYEKIEERLRALGADIERVKV